MYGNFPFSTSRFPSANRSAKNPHYDKVIVYVLPTNLIY